MCIADYTCERRATEAYEKSRQRVADIIGAVRADESSSRVEPRKYKSRGAGVGRKISSRRRCDPLTEMEHHATSCRGSCWLSDGAKLRFVPVRVNGTRARTAPLHWLTTEVKLFAFHSHPNSARNINPVSELCRKARAVGRSRWWIAAQSAGICP